MGKDRQDISNTNIQEQNSCNRVTSELQSVHEAVKIINHYGYEYTLLYTVRKYRQKHHVPLPAFLGFEGYALSSVKKLQP